MKTLIAAAFLFLLSTPQAKAASDYHYDWGHNHYGLGYCYMFDGNGNIANKGLPVNNAYCEQVRPSFYGWGCYQNSHKEYCFQWTPNGHVMNDGKAVPDDYCRSYSKN